MCLVHPCILSRTRADSAGSLVLLPVLAGQHAGVDVVNRVVELIDGQSRHRVLVAVDGSDAAGKTTFADRLASAVEAPTVRVSVDSRNGAEAPPGSRGPHRAVHELVQALPVAVDDAATCHPAQCSTGCVHTSRRRRTL